MLDEELNMKLDDVQDYILNLDRKIREDRYKGSYSNEDALKYMEWRLFAEDTAYSILGNIKQLDIDGDSLKKTEKNNSLAKKLGILTNNYEDNGTFTALVFNELPFDAQLDIADQNKDTERTARLLNVVKGYAIGNGLINDKKITIKDVVDMNKNDLAKIIGEKGELDVNYISDEHVENMLNEYFGTDDFTGTSVEVNLTESNDGYVMNTDKPVNGNNYSDYANQVNNKHENQVKHTAPKNKNEADMEK